MRPVLTRGQKRRTRRAGLAGAEGTGREGDSGIVRGGFTSANTGEQEAWAAQAERVGFVCRSRGMFFWFFILSSRSTLLSCFLQTLPVCCLALTQQVESEIKKKKTTSNTKHLWSRFNGVLQSSLHGLLQWLIWVWCFVFVFDHLPAPNTRYG